MKGLIRKTTAFILVASSLTISASALDIPTMPAYDGSLNIEEITSTINGDGDSGNAVLDSTMSKIDVLFGTTGASGEKYGCLYRDKNGDYVGFPTLYTALSNEEVQVTFDGLRDELTEFAGDLFSDMGNHWASVYVPLPVYFSVLSGYEDGTLKPDNNITCAEVAKVMANTFERDTNKVTRKWYYKYYSKVAKAFTYDNLNTYANYFNKEMTRAEIAYVIANYVSGGQVYQADLSKLNVFADCGLIGTDDDGTLSKDMEIMDAGYIPSRYAKALAYLVEKGIFQGYEENGQRVLNPIKPVTRAEVFTLLIKLCKVVPSYVPNQFTGNLNIEYVDTTPTPAPTSRPSGNTGVFDGDKELINGGITSYEDYMARENITVRWDDPTRPRLKAGDTFIAEDGTAYVLEIGPSGVLGEGLPIATDLGRQTTVKGRTATITHHFQPDDDTFGWIWEGLSTGGRVYVVNERTGEGHWDAEWGRIQDNTKPTEPGVNGQYSEDGNWKYSEMLNDWRFMPT